MRTPATAVFALGAALLLGRPTDAQTISLTPPNAARWDLSASIGWLSLNKDSIAPAWNNWADTAAGSVEMGRLLTKHLKTTLDVTYSGRGTVYQEERITVPGQTFPLFRLREHEYRTIVISPTLAWQFFENTWFHPFLAGGVDLGWERDRIETREQQIPLRPPVILPPLEPETSTASIARPFASAGFKVYVSERAFFRGDFKVAAREDRVAHVLWRGGVGFDF